MTKISLYPNGSPMISNDKIVIARAGFNYYIDRDNLGIWDGWIPASGTWSYGGASNQITIPTDGTTIYQKGDLVRWKQGVNYRYGVIASVAATLLTLITNSDYAVLTPTAITVPAYSRLVNPFGFPGVFNWAPNVVGFTATVPSDTVYQWRTRGRFIGLIIRQATAGVSNATGFTISLPVAAKTLLNYQVAAVGGFITDNSIPANGGAGFISSGGTTLVLYKDQLGTTWTASNNKAISSLNIEYEF